MEGNELGNGHNGGYGKLDYREINEKDRIPDIRTEHSLKPEMFYRGTDIGDPRWANKYKSSNQVQV